MTGVIPYLVVVYVANLPFVAYPLPVVDITLRILAIVVWPAVTLIIGLAALVMFRRSIAGLLQKTKTLELWKLKIEALEPYVAPATLEQLKRNPNELEPDTTRRHVTILYAALEHFTEFAEKTNPADVMSVSRDYLSVATDAIFDALGTIDRAAGSEITAYWGAPLAQSDAADRACTAAVDLHARVQALNAARQAQGRVPFGIRVVVTTGDAVVGDLGPHGRFRYSVVGEVIDLLPSLMDQSKPCGAEIVVTDFTRQEIGGSFQLADIGEFLIKGKRRPVRLYALTVNPAVQPSG